MILLQLFYIYTNILEMSLLRNVTPGKMSQFQESSSYCWWMFSFWWFHTVPTGNINLHSCISQTSHRCIADVHTDVVIRWAHRCCIGVQMCFGHDQVWLGHVTMVRLACIQNPKWPPANFSVFQVYLQKYGYYHKYCCNFITNMEYSCKIEDYTSITGGRKASKWV